VGTPRTYGDRRNDDLWRMQICKGLWRGIDEHSTPIESPVFMTFTFRVNPSSVAYRGHSSPNGRDLDTMVIGALGGITAGTDRPSLRLLKHAATCWGYAATKEMVGNDGDTGVDITVSLRPPQSFAEFRTMLPDPNLSITVLRGNNRKEMAKRAVETGNANQEFFPACTPFSMAIAFDEVGRKCNVTAGDHIEALIDGLGAAVVGERRFFDASKGKVIQERYGYDDSCIFALIVGRFALPSDENQIDAIVNIFKEQLP